LDIKKVLKIVLPDMTKTAASNGVFLAKYLNKID
jgi:hypothetical protein